MMIYLLAISIRIKNKKYRKIATINVKMRITYNSNQVTNTHQPTKFSFALQAITWYD